MPVGANGYGPDRDQCYQRGTSYQWSTSHFIPLSHIWLLYSKTKEPSLPNGFEVAEEQSGLVALNFTVLHRQVVEKRVQLDRLVGCSRVLILRKLNNVHCK